MKTKVVLINFLDDDSLNSAVREIVKSSENKQFFDIDNNREEKLKVRMKSAEEKGYDYSLCIGEHEFTNKVGYLKSFQTKEVVGPVKFEDIYKQIQLLP